jgi:hypothetical protein
MAKDAKSATAIWGYLGLVYTTQSMVILGCFFFVVYHITGKKYGVP